MDWCILRCQSQSTIPLVRSLARAGVNVWTPIESRVKRVPRANVKRTVQSALLPGYLFARTNDMGEVLAIMNSPKKDHRDFRLFKHNGGVPLIADATLDGLRFLERKSEAKANPPQLRIGASIKLTDGGFAGMTGTIESTGNSFSMVRLPGFPVSLKVANFYLLPSETNSVNLAA